MHHHQTSLSLELSFRCSHKFLVSLNRRWQFLSYYLAACSQYISPYPLTRSMMFSMANTTTQNAKRIDRLPFVFRTKLFNFVFIVKILIIHYLDNFMTLQNCYEFMQSFAFVAAGFHTCFTTVCVTHFSSFVPRTCTIVCRHFLYSATYLLWVYFLARMLPILHLTHN